MSGRLKILQGYLYLVDLVQKWDLLSECEPSVDAYRIAYLDAVDNMWDYREKWNIQNDELLDLSPKKHYDSVGDVINASKRGELL